MQGVFGYSSEEFVIEKSLIIKVVSFKVWLQEHL